MDADWILIRRFCEGDPTGFHEIFNKHKSRVVNLSYRFVRSQEAAEDIAQEVFIKVYEKRLKVDPRVKFTTWLYRVTVNASLDSIRRNKFVVRSVDEKVGSLNEEKTPFVEKLTQEGVLSPEENLERSELRAIVQQEIDRLPEKLRSPLVLYSFEKMPYAEIAKILGVTRKAVERRIYHAKKTLRNKLAGRL